MEDMPWALRRKLLYISTVAVIALGLLVWFGVKTFSRPATCIDGEQNGRETGVDCGGECAAVCTGDAREPVVLWTRALKTGEGVYTAAAYIQNPNAAGSIGAYSVAYSFRLLDSDNVLIIEKSGVVDIPPQQEVPIIEPNIFIGEREMAHVFFDFSGDISWSKIPESAMPSVRIVSQPTSSGERTLAATVFNEGTSEIRGLTVAAVLSDEQNVIQAVSKSTVSRIPAQGSQNIVFTWNSDISSTVRAKLIPIPALPPVSL